ncbi:hypothetical protein IP88_14740 [alpha proteobacterium AAP81b]|nr:hypothetical protein IP88_14740 [alpha proteobacterium AAP81b]
MSLAIDPTAPLAAYLAARWDEPVSIAGLRRFHGGSSRQTFRFDAIAASGRREALVLRRDPPASLIETDRTTEFTALGAAFAAGVPVPPPLWLDTGDALGSPGFLMREVAGGRAAGLFEPEPYGDDAAAIGTALFDSLGRIHRIAPEAAGLAPVAAGDAIRIRLDHWANAFAADRLRPEPVMEAAIRWLYATPPPPPQRVALVHGDFRSGNFLFAEDRLLAILDWEMAHAGDPLYDLAWALDPLWNHGSGRPAATLAEAQAIAVWQAASGLSAPPEALAWWRVFAQVKGLAIWISAAREIADGRSFDPVLAFAGSIPYRFHVATLARALAA